MQLEGSCYCRRVCFTLASQTPYPYLRCYCSICRKSAGGGGYAINIMGLAETLSCQGGQHLATHHGRLEDPESGRWVDSPGRRHFCRHCGSALWVADPRWPEWLYPFASAIDTKLPVPPEIVHIMLDFAAPWVEIPRGRTHRHFSRYPDESIAEWHRRHEVLVP